MAGLGDHIAQARPRVIGALAAQLRNLDLAEDALGAAIEALLTSGEAPRDVAAWLFVAAKRKALDAMRKQQREAQAASPPAEEPMAEILELPSAIPDERLRLIFVCCHPAIAEDARLALALRIVCGVPVADIARAMLVSEPAMFQRITRAKAKVAAAGIPFEIPERRFWPERIASVLAALEVAYTTIISDSAAAGAVDGLGDDVLRLAGMLTELLPEEAEVLGLAALIGFAHARRNARIDAEGAMVPLSQQDTRNWDPEMTAKATEWLDAAHRLGQPGPMQLMAGIQLAHARRLYVHEVDWAAIAATYDALRTVRPGLPVEVNRAVAMARCGKLNEAAMALEALDPGRVAGFIPYHVAVSEIASLRGDADSAVAALEQALTLGPKSAERAYLQKKLAKVG